MIYFSYNQLNDSNSLVFKSDTSTQELDRFFVSNQGIDVFPASIGSNANRGKVVNENFGIYRRIPTSISKNKIDNIVDEYNGKVEYLEYSDWCKIAIDTQKRYIENYNPSNEKEIREKSSNLIKELKEKHEKHENR